MDRADKGKSYEFVMDFKNLPMENRVKLINTAKSLLNVQKTSMGDASLVGKLVSSMEVGKKGLS